MKITNILISVYLDHVELTDDEPERGFGEKKLIHAFTLHV